MGEGVPEAVAFVQARMGSTRLPGKVLLPIEGKPVLWWVLTRTRQATSLSRVVLATTVAPEDEPIVDFCRQHGFPYTRGDPEDVLARFQEAAREHHAEVIVRITGDCPLIDPALIDRTVNAFLEGEAPLDYVSNRIRPRYPVGTDVEVMTRQALERAASEAHEAYHREHVTPYLYEEPGRFRVLAVEAERDYGSLRWAVDTSEDLAFVRAVVLRLKGRETFGWRDVLALVENEPEIAAINAGVQQKSFREAG